MKRLFIELKIRDGERDHDHRVLTSTLGNNIQFAAQRYASSYWGYGKRDGNYWYVDGGEIAIKVTSVVEITEFEYKLMSRIFSGQKPPPDYFKLKATGFDTQIQREQIEIKTGKHGTFVMYQDGDKLGFIVDVFGETDHVSTMQVWEEDLKPEEKTPTGKEIEDYIDEWGQTHDEICAELGYDDDGADEMILGDGYFWLERFQKWFPDCSSMYDERDDEIVEYLKSKYL